MILQQRACQIIVALPSCVCRSGPSSLTDDHRTDTRQRQDEPASLTSHYGQKQRRQMFQTQDMNKNQVSVQRQEQ